MLRLILSAVTSWNDSAPRNAEICHGLTADSINDDSDESLIREWAPAIIQRMNVEFVVAFGSRVTGGSRSSSDIDLAVKFADDLSSHERFQKRCFLSGDLQQADAPFIDLSDIEDLPLGVAHDAVNDEFLCGDEQVFRQFKTDIEASFEERRDEIRRQQQAVIDRIAEDGLRG